MADWLQRTATPAVEARLRRSGAVLLEGAKASGKTSLARRFAASEVMLDRDRASRLAAQTDPSLILDGDAPRLLDEYQLVEGLWDAVRGHIDDHNEKGLFLLTGSATPEDKHPTTGRRHTGTGRISPVRLGTLSFHERRLSTGIVSIRALLTGEEPTNGDVGRRSVTDTIEAICIGGWPTNLGLGATDAIEANRDYLDIVSEVDIQRVDGVARDPQLVRRFLTSWGRNVATDASLATISRISSDHELAVETRQSYLGALRRLFLIEDQPAWKPALRSRVRLHATPKRHLVDPSLAIAAVGASPERLLGPEIELAGFVFESQVVHDLRIHAAGQRATVSFYRDNKGLEVDAIVETPDGRWVAFEVKLGPHRLDEGAAHLLALRAKVDAATAARCGGLVLVSADTPTYQRDDGVLVTSLAALGP